MASKHLWEINKHLWEIKHDFGEMEEFNSWDEFYEAYGTADLNMNLLFRWDWRPKNSDGPDVLELYYILQRTGIFRPIEVLVSRDNEDDIKKWLNIKFEHLVKLWHPIS